MIGKDDKDSVFLLLEEGDIILEGDEYYCPKDNTWQPVNDGDPDEDGNYPDAFIGYQWFSQESKPVRRANPDYISF